ncbi:MAG: hypothetical protein DWQ44_05235 [Bacteroidetes bacterium]|nr:MAG: hypothetical protein DWQ33_11880 [Bacteroidota bacterium]REK00778.1 MAG: hypothetical protein DWQ39_11555 [Bacteroidota bacterium]REK35026.1 MAG: hypothetical protein DWQ44_05235 [Bacteroidota bacterium]REK48175.1 MAG: hypothetical protein DWQ48_10110 [Bacteroidota bacterium]
MRKILIAGSILVCITTNVYSQFIISGEFRPRTEYRHGYKNLWIKDEYPSIHTSQRTRLSLNFIKEKLETRLTIQDVRIWGNQSQQNVSDGLLSVSEAWFKYELCKTSYLKAGRQHLVYNDHRIFGNSEWNQQGRSHDALLYIVNSDKNIFHAGVAFNQDQDRLASTQYSVSNNYKSLQFLWYNRKIESGNISVIVLNNGIQSPASKNVSRYSQTVGAHAENKLGKLNGILKAYYQTGTDGASKKDISAYLAGAELGYTLNERTTLSAGLEILSGQSQTDTSSSYRDVIHNFSPPYGTGHKFNGYMDYFYAGSGHGGVGLVNVFMRLKRSGEKFFVLLEPHLFLSHEDIRDPAFIQSGEYRAMDKFLGSELDFTFGYIPQKNVTFQVGYSQMFATKSMEAIKGGSRDETNNWAYIMIVVKPELFRSQP